MNPFVLVRQAALVGLVAGVFVLLMSAPVAAQTPAATVDDDPCEADSGPWNSWDRVTGNWGQTRCRLEAVGVEVKASLVADFSGFRGADARGAARSLSKVGVQWAPWARRSQDPPTYLVMEWAIRSGRDAAASFGEIQGTSNIDADPFSRRGEVYVHHESAGLVVEAGLLDANRTFAGAGDAAAAFLNPSMGFSPTIAGLPTYPAPRPGATASLTAGRVSVAGGAYRRDVEAGPSAFYIGELGVAWSFAPGLDGRVATGLWHVAMDVASGPAHARGPYVVVEQRLVATDLNDDSAGLSGFVQWGQAPEAAAAPRRHVGGGVVWRGLGARSDDAVGVGLTRVTPPAGDEALADETIVGLFYERAFSPALAVVADVQWLTNPGGRPLSGQSLASTLRLRVAF